EEYRMTKYEIMYIIRPDIEEDAHNKLIERFNSILTDNGAEITKVDELGTRRVAYEINDLRDGYYVVIYVSGESKAVDEFERHAKFSDDIIRNMVIRAEE